MSEASAPHSGPGLAVERLDLKLYARTAPPAEALIPVFHRWITQGALGEIWVDVADYRHVPGGPGVLLVAHHAHYGWDDSGAGWGLCLRQRRARRGTGPAPVGQVLADALERLARAALALAREPELAGLAWRTDRWSVRVPDRLHAPSSPEHARALEHQVRHVFAERLPPGRGQFEPRADGRAPLGLDVTLEVPPDLAAVAAPARA